MKKLIGLAVLCTLILVSCKKDIQPQERTPHSGDTAKIFSLVSYDWRDYFDSIRSDLLVVSSSDGKTYISIERYPYLIDTTWYSISSKGQLVSMSYSDDDFPRFTDNTTFIWKDDQMVKVLYQSSDGQGRTVDYWYEPAGDLIKVTSSSSMSSDTSYSYGEVSHISNFKAALFVDKEFRPVKQEIIEYRRVKNNNSLPPDNLSYDTTIISYMFSSSGDLEKEITNRSAYDTAYVQYRGYSYSHFVWNGTVNYCRDLGAAPGMSEILQNLTGKKLWAIFTFLVSDYGIGLEWAGGYDMYFFAGRPMNKRIETLSSYLNGIPEKENEIISTEYENNYDDKGRLISSKQTAGGENNLRVIWTGNQ